MKTDIEMITEIKSKPEVYGEIINIFHKSESFLIDVIKYKNPSFFDEVDNISKKEESVSNNENNRDAKLKKIYIKEIKNNSNIYGNWDDLNDRDIISLETIIEGKNPTYFGFDDKENNDEIIVEQNKEIVEEVIIEETINDQESTREIYVNEIESNPKIYGKWKNLDKKDIYILEKIISRKNPTLLEDDNIKDETPSEQIVEEPKSTKEIYINEIENNPDIYGNWKNLDKKDALILEMIIESKNSTFLNTNKNDEITYEQNVEELRSIREIYVNEIKNNPGIYGIWNDIDKKEERFLEMIIKDKNPMFFEEGDNSFDEKKLAKKEKRVKKEKPAKKEKADKKDKKSKTNKNIDEQNITYYEEKIEQENVESSETIDAPPSNQDYVPTKEDYINEIMNNPNIYGKWKSLEKKSMTFLELIVNNNNPNK